MKEFNIDESKFVQIHESSLKPLDDPQTVLDVLLEKKRNETMQCICKKCQKDFGFIEPNNENLKCLNDLNKLNDKKAPQTIDEWLNSPERKHGSIELGTVSGIKFITSEGIKKMEPGKRYDQNLNEL